MESNITHEMIDLVIYSLTKSIEKLFINSRMMLCLEWRLNLNEI
jgi:hypothetical protein